MNKNWDHHRAEMLHYLGLVALDHRQRRRHVEAHVGLLHHHPSLPSTRTSPDDGEDPLGVRKFARVVHFLVAKLLDRQQVLWGLYPVIILLGSLQLGRRHTADISAVVG